MGGLICRESFGQNVVTWRISGIVSSWYQYYILLHSVGYQYQVQYGMDAVCTFNILVAFPGLDQLFARLKPCMTASFKKSEPTSVQKDFAIRFSQPPSLCN